VLLPCDAAFYQFFDHLYDIIAVFPVLIFAVYGINSILYQRGIYPPETFTRVQKYGLTILVTTDDELKKYLTNILADVKGGLQITSYTMLLIPGTQQCVLLDCLVNMYWVNVIEYLSYFYLLLL